MPKLRSRYKHIKVWRGKNSAYANGRDIDLHVAMSKAKQAFKDEFGWEPKQENTVFECVGITACWDVTIIHVPWLDEN